MLKYFLSFLKSDEPFQTPKPIKYITRDDYVSLTPRQKRMLHSRYELYQKD